MPASFDDQLAIVGELLREVDRMDQGERRRADAPPARGYERELRLAGLAQRIAQSYTLMEGVLAFVRELCGFRHVVRNIYPTRLDAEKVREHLQRLIRAARLFGDEIQDFAAARVPRSSGRKRRAK